MCPEPAHEQSAHVGTALQGPSLRTSGHAGATPGRAPIENPLEMTLHGLPMGARRHDGAVDTRTTDGCLRRTRLLAPQKLLKAKREAATQMIRDIADDDSSANAVETLFQGPPSGCAKTSDSAQAAHMRQVSNVLKSIAVVLIAPHP